MAGPITTGAHPKALWPGVHAFYGIAYKEHPLFCNRMFDVRKSDKAYEELVRSHGFGLAPVKAEGAATSYASVSQKETTRFTNVAYSLGYIVTREEIDDNKYRELSMFRARALARSMRATKEIVAANVLNRAFNSSYVGADGVELCSTAHPSLAGNQANELATAADFSEASLEDMLILVMEAVDYNGIEMALQGTTLIGAPATAFEMQRVTRSTLQSGTANNDINAVRSMGLVPNGVISNPFLTDNDAWFIKTDAPHGLILFQRKDYSFDQDNDFDTKNAKTAAYERYSVGFADWQGVYGSPGA